MKALLFLAGTDGSVVSWFAEDGTAVPKEVGAVDSGKLWNWFENGWKIHGGTNTSTSGATALILRDGKRFWEEADRE